MEALVLDGKVICDENGDYTEAAYDVSDLTLIKTKFFVRVKMLFKTKDGRFIELYKDNGVNMGEVEDSSSYIHPDEIAELLKKWNALG